MVTSGLGVVFFGTPQFAVPTLEALLASRHHVVGVVTQPDRPRGRGHHTTAGPVNACARAAGIDVLQPPVLKDPAFLAALGNLRADVGVVAAYGKILTDAVLATPRLGLVNVHASLLPRYRGAAPIHRAIMAGETETGVTIMRVVSALDAGPMLAAVRHPIGIDDTSEEVESSLAALGAGLLVATLDRLATGPVEEVPQRDDEATYAPRLTKGDGAVDWSKSAVELHNLVRGLHPWPFAFTYLLGERLILRRARAVGADTPALPGTIVAAHGEDFIAATGDGLLAITELQREGKRPVTAREFVTGHRNLVGAQLRPAP